MVVLKAFVDGFSATLKAPRLLALLWLTLLLAAVPFGLLMRQSIADDIGGSRAHVELRQRMDMLWLDEFHDRAPALAEALKPVRLARADFLHNLDLLVGGRLFSQNPALVAAGVGYALIWLLTLGGVVDRFARGGGRFVLSQFLAACGRYLGRLLRLTAVAALIYWLLYLAARWVFTAIEAGTQDVTKEASILAYYLLTSLGFALVVGLVMMVFDYARIASVLDEETNTLLALERGLLFVVRHPWSVVALALLMVVATLGLIALRTLVAPGVAEAQAGTILLVFLFGQLFVLARLASRLALVGAEASLYRALR